MGILGIFKAKTEPVKVRQDEAPFFKALTAHFIKTCVSAEMADVTSIVSRILRCYDSNRIRDADIASIIFDGDVTAIFSEFIKRGRAELIISCLRNKDCGPSLMECVPVWKLLWCEDFSSIAEFLRRSMTSYFMSENSIVGPICAMMTMNNDFSFMTAFDDKTAKRYHELLVRLSMSSALTSTERNRIAIGARTFADAYDLDVKA